jgi:hypothetical protein
MLDGGDAAAAVEREYIIVLTTVFTFTNNEKVLCSL